MPYYPLLLVIFLIGACTVGSMTGINGMTEALYPARVRNTGMGWALAVGRLGGIAGPWLGGDVVGVWGAAAADFPGCLCYGGSRNDDDGGNWGSGAAAHGGGFAGGLGGGMKAGVEGEPLLRPHGVGSIRRGVGENQVPAMG